MYLEFMLFNQRVKHLPGNPDVSVLVMGEQRPLSESMRVMDLKRFVKKVYAVEGWCSAVLSRCAASVLIYTSSMGVTIGMHLIWTTYGTWLPGDLDNPVTGLRCLTHTAVSRRVVISSIRRMWRRMHMHNHR